MPKIALKREGIDLGVMPSKLKGEVGHQEAATFTFLRLGANTKHLGHPW